MRTEQTTSARTLTDILFDHAADGLCLVAPEGTVVRANAEWLRSTGLNAEQVVGENIIELFPGTRDMALAMHARARAGHRVEVPRCAQVVNGRETWWEGCIEPVPMDGGIGLLITHRRVGGGSLRPAANEERGAVTLDELYHRVFEQSFDAVLITKPDGTLLRANAAACRLYGLTEAELRRRDRAERVVQDDAWRAFLAQREANGASTGTLTIRCGDGTLVPTDVSSSEVVASSGERYTAVIFRDASDRQRTEKALRESEEKLRLLANAMPQIVCVLASDGTPEYVNASWVAFSGLDLEATARAGWEHVLHPDDVTAARECRRLALMRLRPQDVELRYRAADGTYCWFLSRLAPVVEGGRVVRFVGAAMEIEGRKRAEEDLREANAKLVEADRRKDEFLGMLSHELRNPLAPIRNSTYILQHAEPASEQARRAQVVIHRQTEHLTRLVDDLLDVTRIARGKIELRRSRVDLREIVLRAADDFRLLMHDRGIRYEVVIPDRELWADADATRITQVVGNLLHNASKFTYRDDTVTLSMTVAGGTAEIRVRDTGAGIDPALVPSIFEPFVQGERTLARTEGGLGLGLALVKGIAELHGGSVRVTSAGMGKGAEFVVRVPLLASPEAESSEVPRSHRRNGGRHVLVVDDNRDAAESLADLVRMLGHTADVAYDGATAIESVRANPPDVVLCDVGLSGMSGYEVAQAVRSNPLEGVLLVAVSGYAQPEDVKRAIEAGFDEHVAKPCDPETIERLLG